MAVQGNKIFIGVTGGTLPAVISVTDGSSTWQGAGSGLPATFSLRDIAASSNAVFVGGQYGTGPAIWQSLDSGATWQPLSAPGLTNAPGDIAPVRCLCVQGNYLYASTVGVYGTNGFCRLALSNGIYNQAPTIVTNPVSQVSMVGLSVMFTVSAVGQGPFSYQWRSNGVNIAGANASTLQLNNLTTNFSAAYSALVWNAYGTNVTTNAVLTVYPSSPGNLDYSFGIAPMGNDTSGYVIGGAVNAVAVQPDGGILAAGTFNRVGAVMGVSLPQGGILCSNIARFLPNGSIDSSFLLPNGASGTIKALALQPDGKILIGGQFTNYAGVPRGRIARLNSNGTLDTNFLNSASGFNNDVNAIVVQADGKIVVGGLFTSINGTNRSYLTRLLSNGDYDTNFLNGLSGPANYVNALAISSNGLYVAGNFSTFNGTTRGCIARVTDTGALDSAFDPANGFNADVNALAVQSDGKVVCVGTFTTFRGTNSARICRITSNGGFDFAYGAGLSSIGYAAVIQSDGKLLVGGNFLTASSTNRARLARYNSDGSVDTFDPRTGPNNTVNALALQSDGQIIVGGSFNTFNGQNRFLLTRVLAAPLATPAPVLQYVPSGTNLQFTWSGNYVVQTNSSLQPSGWATLPGTSPLSIPVLKNASVFFRLAPGP
jgi:uncharacterized delta-60 repeat protein